MQRRSRGPEREKGGREVSPGNCPWYLSATPRVQPQPVKLGEKPADEEQVIRCRRCIFSEGFFCSRAALALAHLCGSWKDVLLSGETAQACKRNFFLSILGLHVEGEGSGAPNLCPPPRPPWGSKLERKKSPSWAEPKKVTV